jgi:hypothetical protein
MVGTTWGNCSISDGIVSARGCCRSQGKPVEVAHSQVATSLPIRRSLYKFAYFQPTAARIPKRMEAHHMLSNSKISRLAGSGLSAILQHRRLHGRQHGHPGRLAGSSSLAARAAMDAPRPKLVLGIETSCDDTGAAVVTTDGRVLGEAIATQTEIHAPWGEPLVTGWRESLVTGWREPLVTWWRESLMTGWPTMPMNGVGVHRRPGMNYSCLLFPLLSAPSRWGGAQPGHGGPRGGHR